MYVYAIEDNAINTSFPIYCNKLVTEELRMIQHPANKFTFNYKYSKIYACSVDLLYTSFSVFISLPDERDEVQIKFTSLIWRLAEVN